MASRFGKIYLLGDAILDNFYWLEDSSRDLRHEIQDLGFEVHNYAADKCRVRDMSRGIKLKPAHTKLRSYPYESQADGKIYPLKLLADETGINRSFSSVYGCISPIGGRSHHTAVLSVGGNDLRVATPNIFLGFEYYVKSVINDDFVTEYENLMTSILSVSDRLILISIYLPYMGPGSTYGKYIRFSQPIMERWHEFLFTIARKYNVPILDLSRTLNKATRLHYGKAETEPSNLATQCIAKCIRHICDNYEGYKIYYAPDCDAQQIQTI